VRRSICLAAAMILLLGCAARRPPESVRALPTTPPAPQATAETGRLGAEQLDEFVARVALYPDELLADPLRPRRDLDRGRGLTRLTLPSKAAASIGR
jgi:hypothetical protein